MVKNRGRQRRPILAPTGVGLQRIARQMLPFYKAVACNRKYAAAWSRAVVSADLDAMSKLLHKVSPVLGKQGLGTNAIGYFISFTIRKSSYSNGVTIPPGTVQFKFETEVHRGMARAFLPLYRKLAYNRSFANRLACAIRRHDKSLAIALIRSVVRSSALKSVHIDDTGFGLIFKFPFSKYPYQNLLFLELEP
ncbi:hypothetical protein RE628_04110 [Paenibacillus sp. D2_2]|uniref:hypothetical protein n=1 Tax=Paenibacillus sp. D2_2 TaxID=3073092 RepID=UPI002814CA33|nr:hypothetical protein [Paenibacillus sp. D2_2]WMT41687.1 hypothetical protein RE628_04110 [Paenibacillus sp. D2_2]